MRVDGANRPWRRCAAAGVVVALTAGAALATAQASQTSGQRENAPRPSLHERLATPLTIELNGERLEDVVRFLEAATGVTMEPMWRDGPSQTGLDRDAVVTATARHEPALSFLERVLEKASDPLNASTWQVSPAGVLQFGPRSLLNRTKCTVVYDVNDLLFETPDFDERVEIDLEAVLGQADGGAAIPIVIADDAPAVAVAEERNPADEIVTALTELIEPEQWTVNGGEGASVHFYNGTLIVHAPEYIHRQIR